MASSDLETKAKAAFIDDHFELAVDLYTQAIALNPNHAELYADRAQANLKLDNFTGTLMAFSFREYCEASLSVMVWIPLFVWFGRKQKEKKRTEKRIGKSCFNFLFVVGSSMVLNSYS